MPTAIFVVTLILLPIIVANATNSWIATVVSIIAVLLANPIIRSIRKNRYFNSELFQDLKQQSEKVVAEHNAVVEYVNEIRSNGSFELGQSSSGQHSHLASFENTSSWNYKRDRHQAEHAPHVHNASLQVVRNASTDPIKYVMKYFGVKADKETLADVQRVAEDISRLENAVQNIHEREQSITRAINPPAFILKHYSDEFWGQVGVHLSPVTVPYPEYKFQYTSAGGNSGQTTRVELNSQTLDALSATLTEKIRWAKSAAGQRSLMTSRLRSQIKERDNYTCQQCSISTTHEPHLLLEIDHIMPISKGGLSVPENLQVLCWRCNRSKGAKYSS